MDPKPLSQEVLDCIADEFPEATRAKVHEVLLGYNQAPINFGRLRVLEAARGSVLDLESLVAMGNRYGQWTMN